MLVANMLRAYYRLKAKGMSIVWLAISLIYLSYLHEAWYVPFSKICLRIHSRQWFIWVFLTSILFSYVASYLSSQLHQLIFF